MTNEAPELIPAESEILDFLNTLRDKYPDMGGIVVNYSLVIDRVGNDGEHWWNIFTAPNQWGSLTLGHAAMLDQQYRRDMIGDSHGD